MAAAFETAAKGTRVNNLWLALVVAVTFALHPAPVRAAVEDLSEQKTDGGTVLRESGGALDRGVLGAASDLESGISGASDSDASSSDASSSEKASSEDGSPKEDVEEKPKKKKKRTSWWPFGKSRDSDSKKKSRSKKKKGEDEEITPDVDVPKTDPLTGSTDAGADAKPVDLPREDETAKDGHKGTRDVDPSTVPPPQDPAVAGERLKVLQESLPAEITERAKRGDSRIKDLLEKAQAIKARQAERDKELEQERQREEDNRREMERESRRLRAAAARGEVPAEGAAPADEAKPAGSKAERIKELQARREELLAEGAPQERLDKIDRQIAALKKKEKEPKAATPKKKEPRSKAARTGKTKPAGEGKKKKTQAAKAKPASDDISAPALPTDAAPEPAPAEEPVPHKTPKKKKKAAAPVAPEAPAEPPADKPAKVEKTPEKPPEAPSLETPAVPAEGNEFKFDSKPSASPGL